MKNYLKNAFAHGVVSGAANLAAVASSVCGVMSIMKKNENGKHTASNIGKGLIGIGGGVLIAVCNTRIGEYMIDHLTDDGIAEESDCPEDEDEEDDEDDEPKHHIISDSMAAKIDPRRIRLKPDGESSFPPVKAFLGATEKERVRAITNAREAPELIVSTNFPTFDEFSKMTLEEHAALQEEQAKELAESDVLVKKGYIHNAKMLTNELGEVFEHLSMESLEELVRNIPKLAISQFDEADDPIEDTCNPKHCDHRANTCKLLLISILTDAINELEAEADAMDLDEFQQEFCDLGHRICDQHNDTIASPDEDDMKADD